MFAKLVVVELRVNERDQKTSDLKRYIKKKIPALISNIIELFEPNQVASSYSGYHVVIPGKPN